MNALDLIRQAEGLRLCAYDDATGDPVPVGGECRGTLTIGYGDCSDVTPGQIITQEEAEQRLAAKYGVASADAMYCVGTVTWQALNDARQASLIDAAYNLGRLRLLGFVMTIRALQLGDFDEAAKQMRDSQWARQVPSRANRDAKIIENSRVADMSDDYEPPQPEKPRDPDVFHRMSNPPKKPAPPEPTMFWRCKCGARNLGHFTVCGSCGHIKGTA